VLRGGRESKFFRRSLFLFWRLFFLLSIRFDYLSARENSLLFSFSPSIPHHGVRLRHLEQEEREHGRSWLLEKGAKRLMIGSNDDGCFSKKLSLVSVFARLNFFLAAVQQRGTIRMSLTLLKENQGFLEPLEIREKTQLDET
jgi:hypothetical protein